jgi:16S rRNA (cytosine1402-N4)-methyltransferase
VSEAPSSPTPPRRRPRYSGKNPRTFAEKYKEHAPEKYPETIAKVRASGKTPVGTHVPIMVTEIMEILHPLPGNLYVDATLGYGGHAAELLARLQPGGILLGIDIDPREQPKTEARLRGLGFGPETFRVRRSNFAGVCQAIAAEGWTAVQGVLADLGVSSMQLDTPERGFSMKHFGPLDMRMNPERGQSAAALIAKLSVAEFSALLTENADEPQADRLATALAGRKITDTTALIREVHSALPRFGEEEREATVRRVFQAIRIAVNEEFSALEMFLQQLPYCLHPGGRVAILSFHSGEDRRVKKAFQAGQRAGIYARIAEDVIRPSAVECRGNSRATAAKLRWAEAA